MNTDKLVQMANQIASFFRAYPEEEAYAGIRNHIGAFWTGRMREALRSAGAQDGLDPLVVGAIRAEPRAESPILKETAGPEFNGQLTADAG